MWPIKRQDKATRRGATPPPPGQPAASPSTPSLPALPDSPGRKPPVPLRGVAEARDSILLAGLLRGTPTPARADEILALLEPHRPRLVPKPLNPLATMAGQSPGRMLLALLRPTAPIIMDVLLPRVRDHLIDRLVAGAPLPDTPLPDVPLPDVIEVAEAMRALVTLLRGGGRGTVLAVVAAVETDGRNEADRITRDPVAVAVTPTTIDELARVLLRFETRRKVLETLGATTALQGIIHQSRRVARFALRRATRAIEGFVANRGLKALLGSLATLASADGLILIALRNLDDQMECREEAGPFVEPADRKALNDCLSAAWRLSDTLFDLVEKAAGGDVLDELLFEAMLHQLRGLHRFSANLTHAGRPAALDTLERRLVERTRQVARLAGERLIDSLMRRPADEAAARRLLSRGRALAQLLLDMDGGTGADLEDLAMRLVVAQDALHHGP